MSEDNAPALPRFDGWAGKIGAVATAAAALLAQAEGIAHESDPFKGLLERARVRSVSSAMEELLPPPVVLQPPTDERDGLILAGHRSHSSHSSHRSHISGSGAHRSHFSASLGTSPPAITAPRRSSGLGLKSSLPDDESVSSPAKAPVMTIPAAPAKKPAYSPPADVDLTKAEERFRLVGLPRARNIVRATLLDHKTGERHTLNVGDRLEGYTLMQIDVDKKAVELVGPNKEDVRLEMPTTVK